MEEGNVKDGTFNDLDANNSFHHADQQLQQGIPVLAKSFSLPLPVPCTSSASPDSKISVGKTAPLPRHSSSSELTPLVNGDRVYPHLNLPFTPEYFFSDEVVFYPNPELLAKMMDMGITERVATKALYWTGNSRTELACNWLFERKEETLNTPLEIEISMFKADLDIKEDEVRERIQSIDSGICMAEDDETNQVSIDSDELDEHKLVLVVNKSFCFSSMETTFLVSRAAGHMIAKVGLLAEGDFQLEMWELCGEQVMIYNGYKTGHLLDLRLAAQCLGLSWVEEGRHWDRVNRRYRDVAVLGIFGEVETVDTVIGRLELMA